MLESLLKLVTSKIRFLTRVSRTRILFLRLRRRLEDLPSDTRIIVVVGMKRSGHHAVISWLANGLTGDQTQFDLGGTATATPSIPHEFAPRPMLISRDRKTIHLNNLPHRWAMLNGVSMARWTPSTEDLQKCRILILSYEDVSVDYRFEKWLLHRHPHSRIYVRRNLANNLASRLHGNIARIKRGFRPSFRTDEFFYETVVWNGNCISGEWITIDFDKWCVAIDYRASLVQQLGLIGDISPGLSHFGGGSSFTQTERNPSAEEVTGRWREYDWHPDLVRIMLASPAASLLTDEQRTWFNKFLMQPASRN